MFIIPFKHNTESILCLGGKCKYMENEETPIEYKDKYMLIFVGESWSDDPAFASWVEGRIEIRKWEDDHGNDQIRYCTKKDDDDFWKFQEKYNCKWLTIPELEEFKKTVQERFHKKLKE